MDYLLYAAAAAATAAVCYTYICSALQRYCCELHLSPRGELLWFNIFVPRLEFALSRPAYIKHYKFETKSVNFCACSMFGSVPFELAFVTKQLIGVCLV